MPVGQNDPSVLDAWVRLVAPRAVAYARSLLTDRHRAEDLVQDCFCRLVAKSKEYNLPADGTKLLFASITNACINETTRRKPMLRLVRNENENDDPPDRRIVTPDEQIMHAELSHAVADGLAELPESQRAAVELKSLGYTQVEIAEMLGVSSTNAGVLIYRGRQKLAERLASFLPEEKAS